MILCAGVYAGLLLFFICMKTGRLPEKLHIKEGRKILLVMAAANTLALLLLWSDSVNGKANLTVVRNNYGKGERTEEMEMTIAGKVKKEPVQIQIQDRKYGEEETKKLFDQILEKLDKTILGKNQSKDKVTEDLNLITQYPGLPIRLEWTLSRYDVITAEGKLQEQALKKEGTLVEVKGMLRYQEAEALYETTVMIFAKEKEGMEGIVSDIKEQIAKEDDQMKEERVLKLPDTWNGLPVTWTKPQNGRGYIILGLGVFGSFAVMLLRKENEKKLQKEREQQMLCDYPEVVSQIVLLLGAGMTMKNVWVHITKSYRKQKVNKERRYVYEEMEYAIHEMQGGVTESEVYERFGRRCGIPQYRKLGALLSQNVRKGTKGLAELLSVEAVQAFEERKSLARKLGEEAGTKLLFPMFLMLVIVMLIIVIPAFLSIQI